MDKFALLLILSLAAAACGDDDTDDAQDAGAGSGGSSAGKGGSGGKGGAGGKGGTGGGTSVAECQTQTDEIATKLPTGCSMCACQQGVSTVLSCDAACWSLIACAAERCPGLPIAMATTCAQSMCMTEINAALASGSVNAVMTVSGILQGSTCGRVCSTSDTDAGADAGN